MATPYGHEVPLWEAGEDVKREANITRYMQWLKSEKGLNFETREELWQWSVNNLEDFWASLWDYFHIKASSPYSAVLSERKMPGAKWFPGAKLNYAEHVFRNATTSRPAVLFRSERQQLVEVSWSELQQKVGSVAQGLKAMGVKSGDRVVAYMPNIPETLIAFLACASMGATWSSCSPDFGTNSVIDRFKQIEPKVLFAVDGYQYGGKAYDRRPIIAELQQSLPTLEKTVVVPYLFQDEQPDSESLRDAVSWQELLRQPSELVFEQVPFDHPLWVLYSSGTTGLPKAIVHGQGGILLEHLKKLRLHLDAQAGDRLFWFTTTGWMMWNFLVGGLLSEASIVLFDGNPAHPDLGTLWDLADAAGITSFGTSAGYIASCQKAGVEPRAGRDLSRLDSVGSTGSPLAPEGFDWVRDRLGEDVWLFSTSGGTDVCTAFVGGVPTLPVYRGELQARALGAKVEAWSEDGRPLVGEVGELVITEPMPSMPLYLWGDEDGSRYRESYFSTFPGVWRHGDWIEITERGTAIITGRSDATINRGGVRMGTSELYRSVLALDEVLDALIVDVPDGEGSRMTLFVVLRDDAVLDN